jgi:Fe-S cluster biosynthesis and repair protein YggX
MEQFEQMLAAARAASDQNFAFWREHVTRLVGAYKEHMAGHDRDALLNNMVKALYESDNDRAALCYQVITLIDQEARRR